MQSKINNIIEMKMWVEGDPNNVAGLDKIKCICLKMIEIQFLGVFQD